MTLVTIVCGAPGSGKSTWVARQVHWGDLVLDIDRLYEAVSMQPTYHKPANLLQIILAMRDAALTQIARPNQIGKAYIITTTTRHSEIDAIVRRFKARVVVLETPSIICMRRIAEDQRRCEMLNHWQELVERWFTNWRDYPGAEVITEMDEV